MFFSALTLELTYFAGHLHILVDAGSLELKHVK